MVELGNRITDRILTGSRPTETQLEALKGQGVAVIVNHRPDGEEPGQPTSSDLAEAAERHGLRYVYAPVSGLPNPDAVEATKGVLDTLAADERAYFFCRSGTRSTGTWAMAERLRGADADELRAQARAAGYDLDRLPL